MTGVQILERYKKINVSQAAVDSLRDTAEQALDFQAQQMFEGKKANGRDITPHYSALTVQIKKETNQVSDRVTLHNTGDFYKGLYFVVKPTSFVFNSRDSKTFKLTDKYGEQIFGLNKEFRTTYINEVLRYHYFLKINQQIGN